MTAVIADALELKLRADQLRSVAATGRGPDTRAVADTTGLRALLAGLISELDEVIQRSPEVPDAKARLTRLGGRCPDDGTLLDFDPFSPVEHRCGRCRRVFSNPEHHQWWVMNQQLFLAERAVHGALLACLTGAPGPRHFAVQLLDQFANKYSSYPNADNVLGPTRPFFSTYLESIWLLQICVAADLLRHAGESGIVAQVIDSVVEPSSALIAQYHEGTSNRQVWNTAALMAASALRDDTARFAELVEGRGGLVDLVAAAMHPDGAWYEGENYHVFAHRGLWYAAEMCRLHSFELPSEILERYQLGFRMPFLSALPDGTMLARRDSQYAVALRQWRFAESIELGLAHSAGDDLRGVLGWLYDPSVPPGDSGRSRSTAEAERNFPASRISRASLGWKALLKALPSVALPGRAGGSAGVERGASPVAESVLLPAQGLAVLRARKGNVAAVLDFGESGGGHGHPDRLNLVLQVGGSRWLDDPGTGSYVRDDLFWYRSSLAHNAPMVGWSTQPRVSGQLYSFGVADAVSHVAGSVRLDDLEFRRDLLATDDFLLDVLFWSAAEIAGVQLPIHINAASLWSHPAAGAVNGEGEPLVFERIGLWNGQLPSGDAGAAFTSDARLTPYMEEQAVELRATLGADVLQSWLTASNPFRIWSAMAPGAPGNPRAQLLVLDSEAALSGIFCVLHCWSGAVEAVDFSDGGVRARMRHGGSCEIAFEYDGSIQLRTGDRVAQFAAAPAASQSGNSQQRGAALRRESEAVPHPVAAGERARIWTIPVGDDSSRGGDLMFEVGAAHFRRSELDWQAHGSPAARIELRATADVLRIHVAVAAGKPNFAPERAAYLDNEPADINSDGIQLHLATVRNDGSLAEECLLLVPEGDGLRASNRGTVVAEAILDASWSLTEAGYNVTLLLDRKVVQASCGRPLHMDVVVNLLAHGRERRSGQLVLRGAAGEWIYLRGDRQPAQGMPAFAFADE